MNLLWEVTEVSAPILWEVLLESCIKCLPHQNCTEWSFAGEVWQIHKGTSFPLIGQGHVKRHLMMFKDNWPRFLCGLWAAFKSMHLASATSPRGHTAHSMLDDISDVLSQLLAAANVMSQKKAYVRNTTSFVLMRHTALPVSTHTLSFLS